MLDWDDLQCFLAVAQHGTLSAAARALKLTQPTVGRRIAAFEARLGAQLFVREAGRFMLSDVGRGVLSHAQQMHEHALSAQNLAQGHDARVEGPVRITASEWMLRSVLGPALGPLLAAHPRLTLELVADARHLSLPKREADLALRPSKFTHAAVFQRAVAPLEFAIYAAEGYLAQHGAPDFEDGCAGHAFVAMTDDTNHIVERDWPAGWTEHARIAARSNGREPMATMAAAGVGLACLPCVLGDAMPGLRRVPTPTPQPLRTLWLGVHRDARRTPRIRVTLAFVAQTLTRLKRTLNPSGDAAAQR
jgi:DNA-binding transcriptional LysR family regulator